MDDDLLEVWNELRPERAAPEPMAPKPAEHSYIIMTTVEDEPDRAYIVRGTFPYKDLSDALDTIREAGGPGVTVSPWVPTAVVETPAQLVEAITNAWVEDSEDEFPEEEVQDVVVEGVRFTNTTVRRGPPRGPDDDPDPNFF